MSEITHKLAKTTIKTTPPIIDDLTISSTLDFYWTNEKDPHTIRRKLIMKKYPQVNKLVGHEPLTKYISLLVVAIQFTMAYLLKDTHPLSLKFLLTAYIIGGTCNQNCFLCIHELCHNLGFKKPLYNRLFSIVTNLPIGIPYSASFQPYHQLHHKFLGDEIYDTDIPTKFEAIILSNVLGKAFFATFQILFYAFRPMFITQVKFTLIHLLNVIVQIIVDYLIVTYWSKNSLIYFIMSSFMAGSLHPTAGHFVSEHYIFSPPENYKKFIDIPPLETYSYYGLLNYVTWNVGYHNEHHDFPFVAWSKLPTLKKIAAEFYDDLPCHKSWSWTIVDFIFNYKVTMYNRVKRNTVGSKARNNVNYNDNTK
ncbi:hypothetical protein CANARDRAFT_177396 [[Candida] arabinofermentans NRRL YB-2248]|uniref:Sphingolipid delta(4)-desaturase n=1 Tax=[Candida] arabinofermentans NRRL YB-2248 TaxID=983967 RepID=A0A1E4SW02_9ASCO|nr:hypothetical protein CANARDRAFT_177396 [[Candida] arabinofermentans NRRL YB-2248]